MTLSATDQLSQLEAARQLVLADSVLYPQIVQGILPIVGPNARIELRRWGAEFLAESFASPALAPAQKESLSVLVLPVLKELLEIEGEDVTVVKNVVQTAASIYGFVFRYIITNPHDSATWDKMAAVKLNILKRWDTATTGVRICCVKFVQKVIQVQTPGASADPRRPEHNEISLALVPRDHPLIPPPKLEPEASGLLDRLLNIFHEKDSDAVLVTATLNCLSILIRTRQSATNKIVSAILSFNPLKETNSPLTPKAKVQIRSMERTTRALLTHVYRRNENEPFAARIKQYLDRLAQVRLEMFDEGSRKRPLPSEPTDGLNNAKRIRVEAEVAGRASYPPLPPGPVSVAQLFTLTTDAGLSSFDVTQLPIDLVVRITLPVLQQINQTSLDEAIANVRSRYLSLGQSQALADQSRNVPATAPDEEEEDDYEPDFEPVEDSEQILNKADVLPPEEYLPTPTDLTLGPFKLPQPPPFTPEETFQIGRSTFGRVFSNVNLLEDSSSKKKKTGLNRLAGSNYDQEAWITVVARLVTRAWGGLENERAAEDDGLQLVDNNNEGTTTTRLTQTIRDYLWRYIIEDFRTRIPLAILWLNEEWLNDRACAREREQEGQKPSSSPRKTPNYDYWVMRVLEIIVPYLDSKDKLLIRFLSEIPAIDERILERVKGLARDPERAGLAVNAIHYLILGRPPVREMCLDAIEDLWQNYDDAKTPATKILTKWRPRVLLDQHNKPPVETNGVKRPDPDPPGGGGDNSSHDDSPPAVVVAAVPSTVVTSLRASTTPEVSAAVAAG